MQLGRAVTASGRSQRPDFTSGLYHVPREAPSGPIGTNQSLSLSGFEPTELARGRDALAVHRGDLGPVRPLVQEALQLVEVAGLALGLDPDRAVEQVLGVAGEPQLAGLALHRPAEADTLDLAPDHGLHPHGLAHVTP